VNKVLLLPQIHPCVDYANDDGWGDSDNDSVHCDEESPLCGLGDGAVARFTNC
jgi:hypothetical protein